MGEITDALRRSRHDRHAFDEPVRVDPSPPLHGRDEDPDAAPPRVEISRTSTPPWIGRAVIVPEQHVVAESFRHFALQLRPLIERLQNRAILITSALRLEGKTTTASNLALALASLAADRRIALVDFDVRRPSIARALGAPVSVGIERVLVGEASVAEARLGTDVAALDVFLVGKAQSRAHELFASRRLAEILEELREGYDTVVIDGPPVLLVPDPLLIAPHVGGAIAVARSGLSVRSAFREMLGRLPQDLLLGCFLNDAPLPRHARKYSSYYYATDDGEARD